MSITSPPAKAPPPRSRDAQGCLVILVAALIGSFVLFRNVQPNVSFSPPAPTATGTPRDNSWEKALQNAMIDYPTAQFSAIPPTAYSARHRDAHIGAADANVRGGSCQRNAAHSGIAYAAGANRCAESDRANRSRA